MELREGYSQGVTKCQASVGEKGALNGCEPRTPSRSALDLDLRKGAGAFGCVGLPPIYLLFYKIGPAARWCCNSVTQGEKK